MKPSVKKKMLYLSVTLLEVIIIIDSFCLGYILGSMKDGII